ncbi:MAG TPA: acyltransferase [Anaerolineales bacterium]|nr:acyltransferase [Anaerolineales bacterium]
MDNPQQPNELQTEQWPGLHAELFDQRQPPLQQYKEMHVGERSWLALLHYELTMLLFGHLPGALGLVLRMIFFRPLFRKLGKNVIFGGNLILRHAHKISLGSNVIIDNDCLLDAKGDDNRGITIGDYVTLGRFSSLVCKNADIEIGSHVNIGSSVKIITANQGKIQIGNSIDIGSSCHFSGGSYDYSDPQVLPSARRKATQGITIQDLCWIGVGVIVLDGVTIGTKSIVGAGAVVTGDIPANSVAAGVPAEVKKTRA